MKHVEVVESDADLVRLRGKPNFRTLGKRFGAEVKAVAAYVGTLPPEALRQLERGEPLTIGSYALLPEDVTVEREVVTEWPVASEGPFVVALDPGVTPALAREGLARELVNRIQRLRKDAGYDVAETRIVLSIEGDEALIEAARTHEEYIASETLAREIRIGSPLDGADRVEPVVIDEYSAALGVRRIGDGRTLSGPAPVDAS